jgi:hypothetical protein
MLLLSLSLLITTCHNHPYQAVPLTSHRFVVWRVYPLLGNDSVNIFPRKQTRANNRTSIARQLISKQAFSTIERLCFLHGPCRGVIKGKRRSCELVVIRSWESSVEDFICCRELGRVLGMTVEGDWEEMARNELGGAKKTSCVIWSDSVTAINPLPGYD